MYTHIIVGSYHARAVHYTHRYGCMSVTGYVLSLSCTSVIDDYSGCNIMGVGVDRM